MADFENQQDPDWLNYLTLRHYCPQVLISIRLNLDIGTTVDELNKIFTDAMRKSKPTAPDDGPTVGELSEAALGAIRYMERNPKSAVGWEENGQFGWRGGDL